MKRIRKIWPLVLTAGLTLSLTCLAFALLLRPQPLEIENIDLNTVADGTYTGIYQNKILLAVVQLEVEDYEIISIEILEHKEAYLPQARRISEAVLADQSLEVDTISGATFTCDTVKKAIEDALQQGITQP
ncbi:FMN-binding protein [Enterococcus sp. AZ109]|uniref:FMN-binding protein n=1 Tax=Enterococcus sp. AZ109 TaxID=2774634 RepID=UPI003F27B77F